jgi:hypothetical protein
MTKLHPMRHRRITIQDEGRISGAHSANSVPTPICRDFRACGPYACGQRERLPGKFCLSPAKIAEATIAACADDHDTGTQLM